VITTELISRQEDIRKLPNGWQRVKLREVCSIHPGQHILESDHHRKRIGIGYLTGPADFGETYPNITKWTENPKAWCEPGDVLVTVKGAGVGKLNLAPNEKVAIGRQLMAIRPCLHLVNQGFLYRVLITCFSKLQSKALGSTVPGLGRKDIESLEIPLPPVAEQNRIAAILDEQMEAVARSRQATLAQLEAAKDLPAAYLRAVFDSPEAQKWQWEKLEKLSTVVRGSSPRPKGDPRYYDGNVPRLLVEDVTRDGMYVTPRVDFLTEEGAKLSRPMKKGDVVMVVSGAPGLPSILAIDACIHDGFVGFRDVHPSILSNSFFFYFLKYAHDATDSQAVGAIFRNLTTDQIKNIKVPLPPLSEQQDIAETLTAHLAEVERLQQSLKSQLDAINKLSAVLLRRAFNGEL
jgi:restriction endonuclease S subunit